AGIYFWDFNATVLWTTFLWLPLEVVASVFFIKGIKLAPLSVGVPFFAFMPVFSALFGFLFLGEKIAPPGLLGIGLILAGSFVLSGGSLVTFLKANRGSLYMLLSALLFGGSVVIGKFVIVESDPVFFAWFYCAVMSAGLLPIVGLREILRKENYTNPLNVPMGLLFSFGMVSYTLALERTLTSYVASIERLAIVLDVIYGRIFFGEEISRNFWGALLMVLGAVLLAF
ncbi:MAG TPA: DMT family transporter, partial [Aquifex aeolicus]|nr:DMT family transporter [Aquifex aeolicus]